MEGNRRKEMTCIRCPLGCVLTATEEADGRIQVTGNTCPRGAEYARNELTDPRRTVTTTVRVKGKKNQMVAVKTAGEIPKTQVFACVEALRSVEVTLPVRIGDVILENVAETGVAVVATQSCKEETESL